MSINVIEYWMSSLIDSDRISESEKIFEEASKYVESHRKEIADGQLSELDNTNLLELLKSQSSKKQSSSNGNAEEEIDNKILICPLLLVPKNRPGLKGSLAPIWIPAKVNLTGKLSPDPNTLPWLSRQLLSPQDSEHSIGDVEIFERFLCDRECPTESWTDYWQFCLDLLKTVTGMDLGEFNLPTFHVRPTVALAPNSLFSGTTAAVGRVYQNLIGYSKKLTPTLKSFTALRDKQIEPLLTTAQQKQRSRRHLGQMTGDHPLSISQRESLYHFLDINPGEILAINGPPGTGKTTLLQSVISSLWIEQALFGKEPPIIVASSANNQAVTNIIASFAAIGGSGDILSERWLPEITSYGLYLASKDKFQNEKVAIAPGIQGFMAEMESEERVAAAVLYFQQKCQECYKQPISNINDALTLLQSKLKENVTQMRQRINNIDGQDTDKTQNKLDVQYRYRSFQLATHYWEGRWLQDCEKLPEEKSQNIQASDWYRYAKLTPCFVSTFFMVPRFFRAYKGKYDEPMYDFIDLLIVDEAGQVSPEIAGASFALAKKALVVGDTLQIEPVWSIPQAVDNGNLLRHKLHVDPDEFMKLGLSAANGSVMTIAQRASRYQKFPEQGGMFLSEHRRCLDEIINYCNQLCYGGKLKPMRGSLSLEKTISLADGFLLPPMGYFHVAGKSEQLGSSRQNEIEARTIADWITFQASVLVEHYDRPLSEIVGVVTPFKQQANTIRHALEQQGIRDVTVGTVHALQGAERSIVIFSSVYDPQQSQTFFFDRQPNMLNVAVSRAKDSFLVFGDKRILKADESLPSGVLAQFLFASEGNALPELPIIRDPLAIITPELQDTDLSLSQAVIKEGLSTDIITGEQYRDLGDLKQESDPQGARSDYDRAIALNPQDANAYNNRGVLKDDKFDDPQGALSDYNQAIILNPQYSSAYFNRGASKHYQLNDYQGALSDYDRAIFLNPQYTDAYRNRGSLKHNQLNDYQDALSDYDRAISLNPEDTKAYNNRGYLKHAKLNDFQGALGDYNQAISLNPQYTEVFHSRGCLKYDELDDNQGALSDFNQAIILNPQYADAYRNRGFARHYQLNDFQGALFDYDRAISLDSKREDIYSHRGELKHYKLNDFQGALSDYDRAIFVNSQDADAYSNRGILKHNRLDDYQGALSDYDRNIALNPQNINILYNRGLLKHQKLNDFHGALSDYSQAITFNPKFVSAYHNRGILKYQKLSDFQGALSDYSQAIDLDPQNVGVFYNRGILKNHKLNDFQGALSDYSQAIALNPQYALAYGKRGSLKYNKLNDCSGGIEDVRKAAHLARGQDNAQVLQTSLKILQSWGVRDAD